MFHGFGSDIYLPRFLLFITIYGFYFCVSLSLSPTLLTGDYQERKKKLGICLTEALKLVILIGILLSIAESLKPKLQIPYYFCSSV